MCYDGNARPPEPPGNRGAAEGKELVLTASDGSKFSAYLAEPAAATKAQVLLYPDVRGLHLFYKELALRFAQVGVRALAIDYFGRTAGLTSREESFEYMPHVEQMTLPTFFQDVEAALQYLETATPDAKTFVVGFCRGGTLALYTGSKNYNLAGLVPFYAGLARQVPGADGTALEEAHKIHFPVLGLFGGADQGIPVAQVEQLDAELDKTNVEHKIVVYENAPHSFFDRKQAEYADASENAWTRILQFINAHAS